MTKDELIDLVLKNNIEREYSDDKTINDLLTSSREDMFKGLDIFHGYTRHMSWMMFTAIGAISGAFYVLANLVNEKTILLDTAMLVGGSSLIILSPFPFLFILIIRTGYKFYVSTLLHATKLHKFYGLALHPWFLEMINDINDLIEEKSKNPQFDFKDTRNLKILEMEILNKRTNKYPHAFFTYQIIFSLLGLMSLTMGIFIIIN